MDIQFQEYNGTFFAINPRIERNSNQLVMKLDEQACTHFLVFSHAAERAVDLMSPQLQACLRDKGRQLLSMEDGLLTDEITVSCVSYREYRMNNYAISLPSRIMSYTVFGCRLQSRQEPETFCIALPQPHMSCSASVSITVSYQLNFVSGDGERRRLNRMGGQSFYVAQFEEIPNYHDGGIVYTLENLPFKFPITRGMLGGQKLYIDAGMGTPKFQTTVSGLNLKKI